MIQWTRFPAVSAGDEIGEGVAQRVERAVDKLLRPVAMAILQRLGKGFANVAAVGNQSAAEDVAELRGIALRLGPVIELTKALTALIAGAFGQPILALRADDVAVPRLERRASEICRSSATLKRALSAAVAAASYALRELV